MTSVPCMCGHERHAPPKSRAAAMSLGLHRNAIEPLLALVGRDESGWISLLRCRLCGEFWAEDTVASGHMEVSFVYPITTEDPDAWLATATSLGY
jgi:hypothetical protein